MKTDREFMVLSIQVYALVILGCVFVGSFTAIPFLIMVTEVVVLVAICFFITTFSFNHMTRGSK